MDDQDFDRVAATFATFHAQFAPLFGRVESQRHSEQYLRGLLVKHDERRNAENLAEAIGGVTPRALQRLLTNAPWQHEPVIAALQAFLGPRLDAPDGVWVVDDTGFAKQGTKSVGVARQYSGTLGKVGNCQIGVGLSYAGARGHALVDMRLYLPHCWTDDRARCQAAGVPATVSYQAKPDLALAMLRAARQRGQLRARWVTADEGYGQVPSFRDALDRDGWWYVLEVPATTPVFRTLARAAIPAWKGRGTKPTRPRLLDGEPLAVTVRTVATELDADDWGTLTVAEGAQGPRSYQFAALRVWESRDGLPGRACWLVLRRNLDGSELKYSLSNAPETTSCATLGRVGATRWCIETDIQATKGAMGLDEYEVRSWQGWHHHITLALLAGAFLVQLHQEWGEKDAADQPPASQSGAARVAAQTPLDLRRSASVAPGHSRTERARQAVAYQTASDETARAYRVEATLK
jgi:SRSO17 transposase